MLTNNFHVDGIGLLGFQFENNLYVLYVLHHVLDTHRNLSACILCELFLDQSHFGLINFNILLPAVVILYL